MLAGQNPRAFRFRDRVHFGFELAFRLRVHCTLEVDGIWLWVHYNKIPIYPMFYLLKGHYMV